MIRAPLIGGDLGCGVPGAAGGDLRSDRVRLSGGDNGFRRFLVNIVYFECFVKSFSYAFGIMLGLMVGSFVLFLFVRKDLPKIKKIFWEFVTYWNEKREREFSNDGK